jgi:hypothetical protein
MQRGIDGSNSVRPGTELFAETGDYLDEIINVDYFNNAVIAVGANGKVVKIDADGNVVLIFDDNFANSLPGSPDGWDTTSFVSFAAFNGNLIIANGVNKPLIINSALDVTFLQDLADLSNANTPVARFVLAHGRYLVMAGDLIGGNEDLLYISATDVSGTWVGDSSPNDAVNVSLGSRVPDGSAAIKGIGSFRDNIVVFFENAILPGRLGIFVEDVHVPRFDDAFENLGAISHRSIQTVGEDMLFGHITGAASIKRALFTDTVQSAAISQLIDPEYQKQLNLLDTIASIEDRTWSLWDSRSYNYMLFIPDNSISADNIEYRCFTYKKNEQLKITAWQDWRNWNFRSGCISSLKKIFLTEGTQVFLMGEENDNQIYKDFEGDQEMWDDETPWTDYSGWNPVADANDSGVPIRFVWELPWSDNNQRFLTKASRYINFDTEGDNRFLVQMFTDNNFYDRQDLGEDWIEDTLKWDDSLGWDVDVLEPTLELAFVGGDGPGFGRDEFGEYYGGGRPTILEQLIAWTARYKIEKLRISGDAVNELKFISITLAYLLGSPRR